MAHIPTYSNNGGENRARYWHVLYIDDVDEKNSERILESAVADFPVPVVFTVVSSCFVALERVEMTDFHVIMVNSDLEYFEPAEFIGVIRNIGITSNIILMVPQNKNVPHSLRYSNEISGIISSPYSFHTLRFALMNVLPYNFSAVLDSARYSAPPFGSVVNTVTPVAHRSSFKGHPTEYNRYHAPVPPPPHNLIHAALAQRDASRQQPSIRCSSDPQTNEAPISQFPSRYSDEAEKNLLVGTVDFPWANPSGYDANILHSSGTENTVSSHLSIVSSDSGDGLSMCTAVSATNSVANFNKQCEDLSMDCEDLSMDCMDSFSANNDEVEFFSSISWENIFTEELMR